MVPKHQGKKRTAPLSTHVRSPFVDPPQTFSRLLEQAAKKRKLLNGKAAPAQNSKKQNVKTVIEIPDDASGSDSEVEEEDLAFFQLHSRAGEFLQTLDKTAIARFVSLKGIRLLSHFICLQE
jgi:flagellar biosynthesis/type III secretory pathway ATPase